MKKTFTLFHLSVLTQSKFEIYYTDKKKQTSFVIFKKCSDALSKIKLNPKDEVVDNILKFANS